MCVNTKNGYKLYDYFITKNVVENFSCGDYDVQSADNKKEMDCVKWLLCFFLGCNEWEMV